ncbi:hypothetical protein [Marinicella rhabdoformis]|uniref:hypothetical protein n=1 Tax=Marinicella rhabdoformis TaxID=2580566 RepID=UPI0012AEB374|nr:hypothetical protein [Marinicella rhabdoformis]
MKYIITLMAMACPIISHAELSIKENLNEAERSPLFQQKFASSLISAKGLDTIKLHNGVDLQFKKYTDLTRLDQNEKFKPLLNQNTVNQYLRARPTYSENVLQLQDRLIVERTMKVSLKPGVCKQADIPVSVNELCFVNGNEQLPSGTHTYLKNLRQKLTKAKPSTLFKNNITVGQLRAMNDEQLLDALLNSDEREISLVSVLPTEVYNQVPTSNLWNTQQKLKTSNFNETSHASVLATQQFSTVPQSPIHNSGGNKVFPTNYFLTGFTVGREITDTIEITLAPSTIFTDRYFVRFEYGISAGFGLRFPFSVSVESKAINNRKPQSHSDGLVVKTAPARTSKSPRRNTTVKSRRGTDPRLAKNKSNSQRKLNTRVNIAKTNNAIKARDHRQSAANAPQVAAGENISDNSGPKVTHAEVSISVEPVNVKSDGSPAYPAVNLHQTKYFNGKEFVLEFKAGCKFKASIPGDDINRECPNIDFSKSRDIDPIIGDDRAKLATLWLDGKATGLYLEVGAGNVQVDVGIQSNLTNGRIRFNAYGYNNTLIENQANHSFLFEDKNTQKFNVINDNNKNSAFNINSPSYGFDLELLPVARAKIKVDLGIKKLSKTLGPYSLDALSMTLGSFSLGHHEGTVSSHIYSL